MTDPISNERLLPCPFCGGEGLVHNVGRTKMWSVSCKNCDAGGNGKWTADLSIAAWNRRQPPAGVEPVAWQCFDCIMEQWSVIDDAELAAARSRRDGEWIVRPLYASPPKTVTITDEMVNEALSVWRDFEFAEPPLRDGPRMRAALTAALAAKGGQ